MSMFKHMTSSSWHEYVCPHYEDCPQIEMETITNFLTAVQHLHLTRGK